MTEQEKRLSEEEIKRKLVEINALISDDEFKRLKGAIGKEVEVTFIRLTALLDQEHDWAPTEQVGVSRFILKSFSLVVDLTTNQKYLAFLEDSNQKYFPRFRMTDGWEVWGYTEHEIREKNTGQILWSFRKPGIEKYLFRGPEYKESDFPAVLEVARPFTEFED